MYKPAAALSSQVKVERLAPSQVIAVEISRDLYVALRPEARVRDTTVAALVNSLIEVLVRDRLVSAVLDDA